ncbi:MAG TPA: hypothetical protein VFQ61_02880 [Polyangiaceae bacterium]|nr:hypothetical protein [Polyangiaceae bacterium]
MFTQREPLWSRLREVREVLMFTFDFELLEQPLDSGAYLSPAPWVPAFVVPNADALVIGRDATGGVYVACDFPESHTGYCLHLDTRGHAVNLGADLEHALALILALPYWDQLLLESPSGNVDELRALALELEREVCDDLPALPRARADLQSFLELPTLDDPVGRLHRLALTPTVQVLNPHGWIYASPLASGAAHPA